MNEQPDFFGVAPDGAHETSTAEPTPSPIDQRARFVAANNSPRYYRSSLELQPTVNLASFPPPTQYLASSYATTGYGVATSPTPVRQNKLPNWLVAILTALLTVTLAIGLPLVARQGSNWFNPQQTQPNTPIEQGPQTSSRTTDVPAALSKGVVLITVTTTTGGASGTGMVLTSDGEVLTNYHVVKGSTSINVEIADTGETYTAQLLGYDAGADVALLQLDGARNLPTVTISEDSPAVGDALTVVGNSEGQGFLDAASGMVTELSASVSINEESAKTGTTQLRGVIETSAAAVSGDSGGPMFDESGRVIAITTAGDSTQTYSGSSSTSYGIPITMAMEIVDTIRAGDESGTVTIGPKSWLGIVGRNTTTPTAQGRGIAGVAVTEVVDRSPAQIAGLSSGSVITEIGGIRIEDLLTLSIALSHLEPGTSVPITWWDNGVEQSGTILLTESQIN